MHNVKSYRCTQLNMKFNGIEWIRYNGAATIGNTYSYFVRVNFFSAIYHPMMDVFFVFDAQSPFLFLVFPLINKCAFASEFRWLRPLSQWMRDFPEKYEKHELVYWCPNLSIVMRLLFDANVPKHKFSLRFFAFWTTPYTKRVWGCSSVWGLSIPPPSPNPISTVGDLVIFKRAFEIVQLSCSEKRLHRGWGLYSRGNYHSFSLRRVLVEWAMIQINTIWMGRNWRKYSTIHHEQCFSHVILNFWIGFVGRWVIRRGFSVLLSRS